MNTSDHFGAFIAKSGTVIFSNRLLNEECVGFMLPRWFNPGEEIAFYDGRSGDRNPRFVLFPVGEASPSICRYEDYGMLADRIESESLGSGSAGSFPVIEDSVLPGIVSNLSGRAL